MAIRPLSPLLVNQIAAGEVIERPASVVKELMENAIDANATRIGVAIEQGGRELIRITDNGSGIPFDELALALAPHATSKIAEADDLDAIATMGFRGEALASIVSVSRLSLTSRPPEAASAGVVQAEGDQMQPPRPGSGPVGTTITVRNLFFNTPARRKFLRTDQTEATRIREVVERIALAHPGIAFTYQQDGRPPREYLACPDDPRQRVLDVIGRELESELLPIETALRGIHLWGLAGRPGIARGTAKHIRVFLNGRPIQDKAISHALREAYRGLIEPGRHPTVVLFMSMDPGQVDVNVHPTKAEVRFRNGSSVHSAVLHAVRDALRAADLVPTVSFDRAGGEFPSLALPQPDAPEFGAGEIGDPSDPPKATASARAFVDYFQRLNPTQKGFVYSEVKQALAEDSPEILAAEETTSPEPLGTVRAVKEVMQVHSSFVITQDADGVLIIDQHALHERVMFEKLKSRMAAGPLEAQHMLMPAVVEVDCDAMMDAAASLGGLFGRLGIEVQPMGPRSLAIHSFTTLLLERKVEPVEFIRDLLTRAVEDDLDPDNDEAALHEVLDMMACKAAIKAGDTLSDRELTELLAYRDSVERSSNCPHGRPTTLRLTIADLERQFGRR